MQAVLHRVELELAVELDDDLSVEGGVRRQKITELAQLREVAKQWPLVSTPERELAAIVLEYSAESIPLRLVLPARALRELLDEERLHRRGGGGPARHQAPTPPGGRGAPPRPRRVLPGGRRRTRLAAPPPLLSRLGRTPPLAV